MKATPSGWRRPERSDCRSCSSSAAGGRGGQRNCAHHGAGHGVATAPRASAEAAGCGGPATTAGPQSGREVAPPGDIPDNQAFVRFTPTGGGYSIKVREGWARTDVPSGVSFTDKFNTVRVEPAPTPNPPTVASAQDREVPAIAAQGAVLRGSQGDERRSPGRPAVVIAYSADSPPDPVTAKVVRQDAERYEFWRRGTEAVIVLSAPHGSDNVDPWRLATVADPG